MDSRIWIHCLRFLTLGFKRWENPIRESKWNPGGFADSRLCLDADSRVWVSWILVSGFLIPSFGFADSLRESKWIRGQPFVSGCGFAGLGFRAWIHGFRFFGVDSRIWIYVLGFLTLGFERWENPIRESTWIRGQPFMSGCGFAGLGFRAWIHGFRFLGFDSRIRIHGFWIPGLGVERWENLIHEASGGRPNYLRNKQSIVCTSRSKIEISQFARSTKILVQISTDILSISLHASPNRYMDIRVARLKI